MNDRPHAGHDIALAACTSQTCEGDHLHVYCGACGLFWLWKNPPASRLREAHEYLDAGLRSLEDFANSDGAVA